MSQLKFATDQEEILDAFKQAQELFEETQRPKLYGDTSSFEPLHVEVPPFVLSDEAKAELEGYIKQGKEVEARFGTYNPLENDRYIPGVPKEWFYNLLKVFQKEKPTLPVVSTTFISKDGVRITQQGTSYSIDSKKDEGKLEWKAWGVRVSVSTETSISEAATLKELKKYSGFENWFIRKKVRWSFPMKSRRFDLTISTSSSRKGETTVFEVEIEFLKNTNTLVTDVFTTLKHMQRVAVENVLSDNAVCRLIWNYNSLFVGPEAEPWRYEVFDKTENKPQSFEWRNVFSGLKYFITPKLDGVRRRIFFDTNGIYEIGPDSRFIHQIAKANGFFGTIIDTEFYNGKYYPFDALFVSKRSLLNTKFESRITQVSDLVIPDPATGENMLEFSKPFYSQGGFFDSVAKALAWIAEHSDMKFDGLIAQSNEPVYFGRSTMKIKPLDELTVDLLTRMGEKIKLFSYTETGEKEETFGSKVGFTRKNLKLPADAKADFIGEYRFITEEPFIVFKGMRNDKIKPNFHKIVSDVYRDFFIDPTSFDDLTDKTLLPWRKWANTIKRKLVLDYVPIGGRVLDIGIGRGGTMLETSRRAAVVYGIDPDAANLENLQERISTSSVENQQLLGKIQILTAYGQETDKILKFIGSPVNVIMSMFSISFFYKSEEDLDKFVETCDKCLDNNGTIIMTFMDGELVRQELEKGPIKTGVVSIKTSSSDKLQNTFGVPITIRLLNEENSIFKKQSEWLAPFDILVSKLKAKGIALLKDGPMNRGAVLPPDNIKFAQLNRMAIFQKTQGKRIRMGENEDYQLKAVAVGESTKIGDKWVRHGVEWDNSSFLRSYLYTSSVSYQSGKDLDVQLINLRNSLHNLCTRQEFARLKNGNVQGRMAFDALYSLKCSDKTKECKTKEQAIEQAFKDYRARLLAGPVGHEAAALLVLLNPNRKIVIISEDDKELERVGNGSKTSYILKVGNYAFSPLSKAEGYVHKEEPKSVAKSDNKMLVARFKRAVADNDRPTVDNLILEVDPNVDNNYAIKTAVSKKYYDLAQMLSMLVNMDATFVVQDVKGKDEERSLRSELIRLANGDKRLLDIIGRDTFVPATKKKNVFKKNVVVRKSIVASEDDQGFSEDIPSSEYDQGFSDEEFSEVE